MYCSIYILSALLKNFAFATMRLGKLFISYLLSIKHETWKISRNLLFINHLFSRDFAIKYMIDAYPGIWMKR